MTLAQCMDPNDDQRLFLQYFLEIVQLVHSKSILGYAQTDVGFT